MRHQCTPAIFKLLPKLLVFGSESDGFMLQFVDLCFVFFYCLVPRTFEILHIFWLRAPWLLSSLAKQFFNSLSLLFNNEFSILQPGYGLLTVFGWADEFLVKIDSEFQSFLHVFERSLRQVIRFGQQLFKVAILKRELSYQVVFACIFLREEFPCLRYLGLELLPNFVNVLRVWKTRC